MPNIGTVLKDEISRLSRREIRKQVQPTRKASATFRREIATLKRQVQALQRQARELAKQQGPIVDAATPSTSTRPLRFVAKGLRTLRSRLGLSAPELARLVGVSDQTVYNWELKKTVPRKEQLSKLARIRSLGKREARRRLESMAGSKDRKSK